MRLILILAMMFLTACAASRNAHYAAQSEYRNAVAIQNAAKLTAVQSAAASCSDDTCRVAVAAMAALVQSERIDRPAQYQSQATSILGLVERAVSVGAAVYGQKIQGESLVDLAGVIAGSAGDRSTHSFIDQSDHSSVDASTHIADSYNSEAGDTISDSGNTTISDSNNGNAGRDLIGGDRVDNSGNIGTENRQDSPGPIDDNSNPGDCDGAGDCTQPEPIDP